MPETATRPTIDDVTRFHGHCCPGLALGFRVATVALEALRGSRASDEELVAVVENDSCAVDAIQVVTGCTFGKGNFRYHSYGKHVYTFYRRATGEGIRIAEEYRGFEEDPDFGSLRQRVSSGTATSDEQATFRTKMRAKTEAILAAPAEEFLSITPARHPLPARARIEPSERCADCQETVMASHLVDAHGKKLCQECAAHATAPGSGRLLSRFTTVELLVIASMVAADFGFGLLVKPLLTAMHLTSVVRLDMILPLAMVLLTRLIVDKFGTLTLYQLLIGILATLAWPESFGLPGPLKLPLFLVQGLIWDGCMSVLRPWLVPRLLVTTLAGAVAASVTGLGLRVALGLPFAPLVKLLWGVQLAGIVLVGLVATALALAVWRSLRHLTVVRRIQAWRAG